MSDLTDGLIAASRAAPGLDPSAVYGVAQSAASVGHAAVNATAAQAFQNTTQRVDDLRMQSGSVQAKIWAHLSPEEQQMFQAAGYKQAPQQTSPWWRSAIDDVGGAFATAGGAVGTAAKDVLNVAGAPLRAVQHVYRTTNYWGEHGEGTGTGFNPFDTNAWAESWNRTENGEQTFDPKYMKQVQQQFAPDTVALAKQLASGVSPDSLVKQAPAEQRPGLIQRINTDSDLHKATSILSDAKLSEGRQIAESLGAQPGSKPFHYVSGVGDALNDWYTDPLNKPLAFASEVNAGRYVVQTPEDVYRVYQAQAGVRNYAQDVADAVKQGGVSNLLDRHPNLAAMAPQLKDVQSGEDVRDVFADHANFIQMAKGRAGALAEAPGGQGVVMPHLGVVQSQLLDLKQAANDTIHWAADAPYRADQARVAGEGGLTVESPLTVSERLQQSVLAPIGRTGKMFTELTANGRSFNPSSPEALTNVQRFSNYYLPKPLADNYVNLWAEAPGLGTKQKIYDSMLDSTFRAAQLDKTPEGQAYMDRFLGQASKPGFGQMYASDGVSDKMLVNGTQQANPLYEHQASTEWGLPAYRDLLAQSRRAGTASVLYGPLNNDLVTRFMDSAWRPLTLLRLGFATRAGGEEAVGQVLRDGPGAWLRSKLAESAASDTVLMPHNPVRAVMSSLTDHLPDSVGEKVQSAADFMGQVLGDRAARAMRNVAGKFATEDYVQGAREMAERGYTDGMVPEAVSAMHGQGGYLADPEGMTEAAKSSHKVVFNQLKPSGAFRGYGAEDPMQMQAWKYRLDRMGDSGIARTALGNLELPRDEQVQKLADYLDSPGFANMRSQFGQRAAALPDGSTIAAGDATARQVSEDWAGRVLDDLNSLIRDPEGNIVQVGGRPLDQALLEDRKGPGLPDLNQVPITAHPQSVTAPEFEKVPISRWQSMINNGFETMVGRPMNWIARQPMFLHNYVEAKKELDAGGSLASALGDENSLRDIAFERATAKTVPYIHNPELRSQYAQYTRNLMPFWFAQEQFMKRWAHTFVHSPDALREAQLTMMGLRHSGFVHTDANGNDYFMYPAASMVQDVLSKGMEMVTGHPTNFPIPVGFSGQVQFATPGLERLGTPSFGPLAAIPLHALASRFPELSNLEPNLLGQRGVKQSYWDMILPTTMDRVAHYVADNPDTPGQMHSATLQAIQYLAANKMMPGPNDSPDAKREFSERVKNWARTLMLTRLLYGFSVPASPDLQMDPDNLHKRFSELLGQLPIEQAIQQFMKESPDATPYTVFQSKSFTPLPATQPAMDLLSNHESFFKDYPMAAGWFLPQTDKSGSQFSASAYREQMVLGLRQAKTVDQFIKDIYYSEAADKYFKSVDAKNAALAASKSNPTHRANIQKAWDTWKTAYYNANPDFADAIQSNSGHTDRMQGIDQLHMALVDPRMPKVAQTQELQTLLASWDSFKDAYSALGGQRTSAATNRRNAVVNGFKNWAGNYTTAHPDVLGAYNRLMRPELASA